MFANIHTSLYLILRVSRYMIWLLIPAIFEILKNTVRGQRRLILETEYLPFSLSTTSTPLVIPTVKCYYFRFVLSKFESIALFVVHF